MRMNRRNVLMGLGTIVVGGGAALGSGAFSQVEASRSVTIATANDANALIALEANGDSQYVTNDGGSNSNLLKVDLSSDALGDNAEGLPVGTTTIDDAFTVHNNHTEAVDVTIPAVPEDGGNIEVNFSDSDDATFGTTQIGANSNEGVSIEIVVKEGVDTDATFEEDVTITAEPVTPESSP